VVADNTERAVADNNEQAVAGNKQRGVVDNNELLAVGNSGGDDDALPTPDHVVYNYRNQREIAEKIR
jgi:hypothetical protein